MSNYCQKCATNNYPRNIDGYCISCVNESLFSDYRCAYCYHKPDTRIDYDDNIYMECEFCEIDFTAMASLTKWRKLLVELPQGDERQVLIKRDNGRGGFWIDLAWWRPSANCFDDGVSVDYWCEIPE